MFFWIPITNDINQGFKRFSYPTFEYCQLLKKHVILHTIGKIMYNYN